MKRRDGLFRFILSVAFENEKKLKGKLSTEPSP